MSESRSQVELQDGTLIRHKVLGYEGRIEGTTEIKGCFTAGGELLDKSSSKQTFQYRVVVKGETMRRIAPAADLEILDGILEVVCPHCRFSYQTKPGLVDKPRGRCRCGGWICPSCLDCRDGSGQPSCPRQKQRVARSATLKKHLSG